MSNPVSITDKITVGGDRLLLIAGPCLIESLDHCLMIAERLIKICGKYSVDLVFKSSYDKANRTSLSSKRGPGMEAGLKILDELKKHTNLPVISDIHQPSHAGSAAEVLDILQIPAFLCRQTDLLLAAGATGKPVNLKKGQFLHPSDMKRSAGKISAAGNHKILLCERGTCFGYRDLVVDMRSLVIMKEMGYPVIFDATHSVQQMGAKDGVSGGTREYIKPLVRAAAAVGIDGLFIECHPEPDLAPCDGANMLPLSEVEDLLKTVCRIREAL